MTNNEFFVWLNDEFAKYPLIAKSNPKSVNELCYVLRRSGKDFCINSTDATGRFSFMPSVVETFIPTRDLAKKIKSIRYEEMDDTEVPIIALEVK